MARRCIRWSSGGVEWLLDESLKDTLPRLPIEKCRHPDRLDEGELVKDNPVRTVVRLADPDSPPGAGFFLKRYKFKNLKEKVKHLLVPTKPRREWDICRGLQSAGIPTCDVVAVGHRTEGFFHREAFLLSREIPGVVTLKEFLSSGAAAARKVQLAEDLAELTAKLLKAGYVHQDFHAENLLVDPRPPGEGGLYVLDLHRIRKGFVSRRGALRMLGMLAHSTDIPAVGPADRKRFVRAFLRRWKGIRGPEVERWDLMLLSAWQNEERRHMRSRTRRCVLESSLFTREKTAGFRIYRRRDYPAGAALEALKHHEKALVGQSPDCRVLKAEGRSGVVLCPSTRASSIEAGEPSEADEHRGMVCVKSFCRPTLADRIKDCLRWRSRAKAAWIAMHGFRVRGLPTAAPLALLESCRRLAGRPDFLVMEALSDASSLHELSLSGLPGGQKRRELGAGIAGLLTSLSAKRVYHPDTKPTNIRLRETDGGFQLWLVDMARVRFDTEITRATWIRYLAHLNAGLPRTVSLLDRMRCLRECSKGRWSPGERKEIARAVYKASLARSPLWAER